MTVARLAKWYGDRLEIIQQGSGCALSTQGFESLTWRLIIQFKTLSRARCNYKYTVIKVNHQQPRRCRCKKLLHFCGSITKLRRQPSFILPFLKTQKSLALLVMEKLGGGLRKTKGNSNDRYIPARRARIHCAKRRPAIHLSRPSISFLVNCKTQEKVDELWKRLSEGGEIQVCGWLKDRYGVSWQIVPPF